MLELNNETRNFFSTVVVFLFIINLTIAISCGGINFITLIFFSIIPSVIFLFGYISADYRNRKEEPQDQEN